MNPHWSAQQALATSEVLVPDSTEEELTDPACSCSKFAGPWMIGVSENMVIQTVLLGSHLLSVHQGHLPKPYNPSWNGLCSATPLLLISKAWTTVLCGLRRSFFRVCTDTTSSGMAGCWESCWSFFPALSLAAVSRKFCCSIVLDFHLPTVTNIPHFFWRGHPNTDLKLMSLFNTGSSLERTPWGPWDFIISISLFMLNFHLLQIKLVSPNSKQIQIFFLRYSLHKKNKR